MRRMVSGDFIARQARKNGARYVGGAGKYGEG
jgi:hypothetical protein